jgi:lipopolysaccharide biosynthesis glycosyltransferase
MNIVFLHVGEDTRMPEAMLDSVWKTCYFDSIIQLTDEKTPKLDVSRVIRLPWDGQRFMEYKLRHLAALDNQNLLWLDTDVIVQTDLKPVFGLPFDVALTRRSNPVPDAVGTDAAKVMPYNTGVVFSRKQRFWESCLGFVRAQPEKIQQWYGDQYAAYHMSKYFHLLTLDCENFNYTPETADEDVSRRYAVHYKGHRKDWVKRPS